MQCAGHLMVAVSSIMIRKTHEEAGFRHCNFRKTWLHGISFTFNIEVGRNNIYCLYTTV